jgi:hypothetical protein
MPMKLIISLKAILKNPFRAFSNSVSILVLPLQLSLYLKQNWLFGFPLPFYYVTLYNPGCLKFFSNSFLVSLFIYITWSVIFFSSTFRCKICSTCGFPVSDSIVSVSSYLCVEWKSKTRLLETDWAKDYCLLVSLSIARREH